MTWILTDLARFKAEREGLERFGLTHDWFVLGSWRFDKRMRLVLDADIIVGDRTWPVYLQFPDFFPHTPPSVFPRGDTSRWSYHQYGEGGELCLEYGPDNWTPDLTGVHVIESAHRLLQGENPTDGQRNGVASRHSESLGRELRVQRLRFLITQSAAEALSVIPTGVPISGTAVHCYHKEATVNVLRTMTSADGRVWTSTDVPIQLVDEYYEKPLSVLRVDDHADLPPTTNQEVFRAACAALGLNVDRDLVLILKGKETHYHWMLPDSSIVVEIPSIPPESQKRRVDEAHDTLRSKKVGLVGCGSLGSKVATMMARAGVGKWLLADDDLFLPNNLVRHELDWRDAGTHKAQSLARHLQFVNPDVETNAWNIKLGTQTASASAEAILKLLGECDLIFDATANPNALNIISAVALEKSKPVIWAEVFGGGIGGLIARCRPGLEPSPQHMRRAIENWFGDQSTPPVRSTRSYETGGDEAPLIADDADVAVIASHAARFAIDLLARQASIFPHSVYAIGLGVGSVFCEPFDTRPIDVGTPLQMPKDQLSEAEIATEFAKLVQMMKPSDDETAAAPKDH